MPMKLFDLTGKVAIVTGGNGGIGLGMAKGLAAASASIFVVGRNPDKNAAAVEELKAIGAKAEAFVADVTSGNDDEAITSAVYDPFRLIAILITNAAAPF